MDTRFWTAFVAGMVFVQMVYSALFGHTGIAVLFGILGIWNIYLNGVCKEMENAERNDETL
jgi:hypothetical protein